MPVPQFTLNRTCSVTVPTTWNGFDADWFGFDITSWADAGDYLLAWGGFTYNESEPNDPFYFNVVKIRKSDFTVVAQTLVNTFPDNPFFTVAHVICDPSAGDAGEVYLGCWTWDPETSGIYQTVVLSLDTFAVLRISNQVTIEGDSIYSGGNEVDAMAYLNGGKVIASGEFAHWIWQYDIESNTLAIVSGVSPVVSGSDHTSIQVASDGTIYRLTQQDDGLHVDKSTDLGSSFTNLNTFSEVLFFGDSNEGAMPFYLDEPESRLYVAVFISPDDVWKLYQVSTVDGSLASSADLTPPNGFPASAQLGWTGLFPATDDAGTEFYLVDKDGSATLQTGVIPPADDGFWDVQYSGSSSPMYGNALTNDLAAGDTVTFYEYTSGSSLGVTPASLAFVNHVWGWSPAVGDGQGIDGTDRAQQVSTNLPWAFSQAPPWLKVTPGISTFDIANVIETANNVVTLTCPGHEYPVGQSVRCRNLTTATWLNNQFVTLISTTDNTVTFIDPTGHGAQASHAETGQVDTQDAQIELYQAEKSLPQAINSDRVAEGRYAGVVTFTGFDDSTATVTVTFSVGYSDMGAPGITKPPSFDPSAGQYIGTKSITIEGYGAEVHFTTDGSTPTRNSTLYTAPISVAVNTTVKAVAFNDSLYQNTSAIATAEYLIQQEPVTFSPPAGSYDSAQTVTLSSPGSDAIYIDGVLYTGPVTVDVNTTLAAIAVKAGRVDSKVSIATYSLRQAAPEFSPDSGSYSGSQTVTITSAGADQIRYRVGGFDPHVGYTIYSGPITVAISETVKAYALKTGWSDSEVATAVYDIT